jgi:hypothetical protein
MSERASERGGEEAKEGVLHAPSCLRPRQHPFLTPHPRSSFEIYGSAESGGLDNYPKYYRTWFTGEDPFDLEDHQYSTYEELDGG